MLLGWFDLLLVKHICEMMKMMSYYQTIGQKERSMNDGFMGMD